MDAYEYDSFDTGKYGPHKADGVALQLPSITTGLDTYAVFNASLKRERTTIADEKGSPLPPDSSILECATSFIASGSQLVCPSPSAFQHFTTT